MSLSSDEEELYEHAIGSIPRWVQNDARAQEDLRGAAKIIGRARIQREHWQDHTLIGTAVGQVGDEPDFLAQHARDRGTDRQVDETDAGLRERLRNTEDAVTRPALMAAAQAIIDEEAIAGDVAMVELPRDAAYMSVETTADAGTGGTFTNEGADGVGFEPDTAFARPPYRGTIEELVVYKLFIDNANSAGNEGTFTVNGLEDDKVLITNASAVYEADATLDWEIRRYDRDGNLLTGFQDSYFDRGDRFMSQRPCIVMILPYGSEQVTEDKVREMLRQKKAAGIKVIIERRLNP